MRKVSFTIVRKNKYHNAPWYVRMRETGQKDVDVNLGTPDRRVAETELMRVKLAASEGSSSPLDALAIRRKGLSEPVSVPGGVLEGWERWMAVSGLRRSSIDKYVRAARVLMAGMSVADLSPDTVRNMMAGTVHLKANTRRVYLSALRELFMYLERPDLADVLPRIKTEVTDRTVWSREDMEEIIMCVSTRSAQRTLEYREYFGVMAYIGSRQGETYALRWKDIDEATGVVHFRAETTKSRKERYVPLPTRLWSSMEVRRGRPDEQVFPNIGKDQATRFGVLSRAIRKAGVEHGGLHTFRHSCASLYYRACSDIKAVAELLGHSPSVSLQYYQNSRGVDELRKLVENT